MGLLFGVGYAFRNCESQMKWYYGPFEKKLMRAIIANGIIIIINSFHDTFMVHDNILRLVFEI